MEDKKVQSDNIKKEIARQIIRLVTKKILASIPALWFLPNWIVTLIVGKVVERVGYKVIIELNNIIESRKIVVDISKELNDAKGAMNELVEYEKDPALYTPEQKEALDTMLINNYRALFG